MCPRCQTPAAKESPETETKVAIPREEFPAQSTAALTDVENNVPSPTVTATTTTSPASSTLLEFPGVSRASLPPWRKELSVRVREIQERRARDAMREAEEAARRRAEDEAAMEAAAPQLGLVPAPDAPPVNPIVAAALKRIERARQPMPPLPRARAGAASGAAAAVARVIEESYQSDVAPERAPATMPKPSTVVAPLPKTENAVPAKIPDPTLREHTLMAVPSPQLTIKPETISQPQAKRVITEVVDDAVLARLDAEAANAVPAAELYDDRAPLISRIVASVIDLFVVAFASSPFAAIIELSNSDWADWRVEASMGGIIVVVMFLYFAASNTLAGRTWGMSLLSVRVVDASTGLPPTTKQSVGRALTYIISLAASGLGILYALFDAEGRTVSDHLSGTAVVRE